MPSSPVRSLKASAFTNQIGINIHLQSGIQNNGYKSTSNVLADLQYLSVTNVRDSVLTSSGTASARAAYTTLAQNHIAFDLLVGSNDAAYAADLAGLTWFAERFPGALQAIEGPNEIQYFPISYAGRTGAPAAVALQTNLYHAVATSSVLKGTAVYDFTEAANEPVAGAADFINIHVYPANGDQPAWYVPTLTAEFYARDTATPEVATEAGYNTDPLFTNGVTIDVQAKDTLNLLFDDARDGLSRTYLYELLDENADPNDTDPDQHWGLFDSSNRPKPVATALHNLSAILADTGAGAATAWAAANYTVPNLPQGANTLLLTKSSGASDIVLWAEPKAGFATEQFTTVDLGATYATVTIYDPLSGTTPVETFTNAAAVSVALTDHPVILEVAPQQSSPCITSGIADASKQTIIVRVSEDAWRGDAQYTLAVDGATVGGVRTATAPHALGQTQDVTLTGDFGPGGHIVSATFLNDAYGGTITSDRNLYIDGVTTGASVSVGTVFWSNGSANLQLNLPAGAADDSIVVNVSEDAWLGDAQYTLAIDGVQAGGVRTASALHAVGQSQEVTLSGSFGYGAHILTATFLNDAYGGSADKDRNLYIDRITAGGNDVPGTTLSSNGTANLQATTTAAASNGLTIGISEDAWNGDAQYTIAIDGAQVGGVRTAMAIHGLGQRQEVTVPGTLSPGAHAIAVAFLNDAYGGSATTDRNLYVDNLGYGGASAQGRELYSTGSVDFALNVMPNAATPITSAIVQSPTPAFIQSKPSPGSSEQVYTRNAGSGTASLWLGGVMSVLAGAGASDFFVQPGGQTHATIYDFDPARDRFVVMGYAGGAAFMPQAGSSVLQLSDGSDVTFFNVTGLTAANLIWR